MSLIHTQTHTATLLLTESDTLSSCTFEVMWRAQKMCDWNLRNGTLNNKWVCAAVDSRRQIKGDKYECQRMVSVMCQSKNKIVYRDITAWQRREEALLWKWKSNWAQGSSISLSLNASSNDEYYYYHYCQTLSRLLANRWLKFFYFCTFQ